MLSINNNSAAQSILSNLNNVESAMSSSYQQLSTGNQVNSAADNPASYAISQQMTSQVNGLNQATQNAQNGISMIQTATGAMNQIEQVLQTMSTLATESANAGNTFSDRANLQLEMNALAQQINATTNQTQYNGISLLTGQFGNGGLTGQSTLTLQIGANHGQTLSFNIGATDAGSLGVSGSDAATGINAITTTTSASAFGTVSGTNYLIGSASGAAATDLGSAGLATGTGAISANNSLLQSGMTLQLALQGTVTGGVFTGSIQLEDQNGNAIGNAVQVSTNSSGAWTGTSAGALTLGDTSTGATLSITLNALAATTTNGTVAETDKFLLDSSNSNTSASQDTGWQAQTQINGINIMDQAGAQKAITAIQSAINNMSSSQAQLGAIQNRLNYTVSNLSNSSQNLQNAQSTITNTDMAAAYTKFSQQQVLEQVGISMLSQAQQQPQMILKLLQ